MLGTPPPGEAGRCAHHGNAEVGADALGQAGSPLGQAMAKTDRSIKGLFWDRLLGLHPVGHLITGTF